MATPKPFHHAGLVQQLEQFLAGGGCPASWPAALVGILRTDGDDARPSPAASQLLPLLRARQAVLKAGLDNEQVADTLRRYQKFAKPGQPSPHIVQLRQQQATARQASSQSRQSLIQAAAAFVREAGLVTPPRMALEAFIIGWMDASLPTDSAGADASMPT